MTILTAQSLGGLRTSTVQEQPDWYNMLIYGDSGVGKTVLSASASVIPEMSPVIMIDIEGGSKSLRTRYPNVEVVRVKSWQEMQDVYNELYNGNTGYQTCLVDSLTEVQHFDIAQIMLKLVEEHPDRDIDVPSKREWGVSLSHMRKFVRGFRDLPMHTIFTALNVNKEDNLGREQMKPLMSGSFINEAPGLLDEVYYYYIKDIVVDEEVRQKRILLTQKTEKYVAKTRTEGLPMYIEDPTMQTIYDLLSVLPQKEISIDDIEIRSLTESN